MLIFDILTCSVMLFQRQEGPGRITTRRHRRQGEGDPADQALSEQEPVQEVTCQSVHLWRPWYWENSCTVSHYAGTGGRAGVSLGFEGVYG